MRKFFKKSCGIILAAALTLGSFNMIHITSAGTPEIYTDSLELYSNGAVVPIENDYVLSNKKEFLKNKLFAYNPGTVEETIYTGLLNSSSSIDISAFQITKEQLNQIMQDVVNTCPDLFYVANQYQYYIQGQYITQIIPQYTSSGSNLQAMKNVYNSGMNNILSKVDRNWSDLEKIVFVHDYICQNFEYDTTYSNYDAYSFFSTGKGVCQAYTAVFSGIMKELGIDVSTASSDSMGHIWNVVKLNGNWYHLDATWDDPLNDKFSLANHNNLLVSDNAFSQPRVSNQVHTGWVSNYSCTDTTYDNYYWMTDGISSPFKYLDGRWFYAYYNTSNDTTSICAGNLVNRGGSVYDFGKWFVYGSDNSYFTRAYCGLDVYNNTLYFNTCDTIYKYTSASGTEEFGKPDVDGRLCGLRINGQSLVIGYTKDYNNTANIGAIALPDAPTPPINTIDPSTAQKGDVDLNGKINISDVTLILRAALNMVQLDEIQTNLADIDGNNKISITDTTLCLRLALNMPIN